MSHIGPYAVERRLGGGGMAEVFLARLEGAEGFSAPVAIKRVLPHFADQPAFAAMFISEAKLSARLRHPNIVSVLDFNRDAAHGLFLVMELVDGKDLAQLVATGRLPVPLAIYIATEVLRGLGHAHNPPRKDDGLRGIVHRDISPQNVLLSWEGEVKISDFGIAKSRETTQAAASVMIKGKPAYMSPEQADGRPLDGKSDLFAVGIMLWEMLTGNPLFAGSSTQEILASLLWSPISAPTDLRPELPADVCAVVMRLLERDASSRYPTAESAMSDLLACSDAPRDGRTELAREVLTRFPHASQAPTILAPRPLPTTLPPPSRQAATWRVRGWSVPRLWLAFLVALFGATAATLAIATLVKRGEAVQSSTVPTSPQSGPQEAPTQLSPSMPPKAATTRPTEMSTTAAPNVEVPTATAPGKRSRSKKRPSSQETTQAAPNPSGIVEVRF